MSDPQLQRSAFSGGEGDAWYQRNASALGATSPLRDRMVADLAQVLDDGARVLEIGCGNGAMLASLAARRRIDGHGIEPSRQAVDDGCAAFPQLHLRVGTADALPYDDGRFDLVVFGFCLYLIDRALLWRCIAEADRVLAARGWLAILDFDPPTPRRRAYHHRPGLWSWKDDHSRLFLAHPAYRLAQKWSASHAELRWADDPDERVGFWLLRKDESQAWPEHTG